MMISNPLREEFHFDILHTEDRMHDKCVVAMYMSIFTAYLTLRLKQKREREE